MRRASQDLMMMSETVTYVKFEEPNTKKKPEIPVTIEWNGERMIRNQSIRVTVKEILRISESLDVVKINIVGGPGSGKTTLSTTIGHLVHKMSELPFAIRNLNRKDLLNFEAVINTLTPTNYVLIFDDVSFLSADASKGQIEIVKKAFTMIRHLPGGQDIRIIALFNFHYNFGLDKYLRQSEFSYWTAVGSSELENMQKIIGVNNTQKIQSFQKVYNAALIKKKFGFLLGKKWFIYPYRKPYAPVLFWNNVTLRTIVFPKREWVDKLCSVCIQSKQIPMKDGINVNDFANDMSYKFGKQLARTAVRMKCFQNGINVFPKRVKQCMKYIDQHLDNRNINLQEVADFYGFKNENTRLDEKLDDVLDEQPKIKLSVGGILGFDINELKTFVAKKPRDNWVEPFYKQTKQDNLKEYGKLQEQYRDKPEPLLATQIKALCNVIKRQK